MIRGDNPAEAKMPTRGERETCWIQDKENEIKYHKQAIERVNQMLEMFKGSPKVRDFIFT